MSLIRYHNFVHKLTKAARSRCQFIEKIEQKTLAFVTKKSIKKEAEWKLWPKIFFAVYFWEAFNIDIQLVCYHAVFSVVTQRFSSLIEPHSFPAISQIEFRSHFLEGVRATFAVWWLLQSQLCLYRCPMCEWQNNQNRPLKTSNQLE